MKNYLLILLILAGVNIFSKYAFADQGNKPELKIIYSNDTTNLISALSPYHKEGGFSEDRLRASIDEVADKGVDIYVLEPGYGWVPWWKSEIMPAKEHFEWFKKTYNIDRLDTVGQYLVEGGDIVDVFIEHCNKTDMIPFISYRLNDHHGKEYVPRTEGNIEVHWATSINKFYYEHPEYRLGSALSVKKCMWPLLNWAIPEVREHKFKLIEELCQNYEFGGLQLDFIRHPNYFRQNETTSQQRKQIMTDFVSRIRKMLDANKVNGKERKLCVRVPCYTACYDSLGIDLESWAKAGVEMVVLSPFYFMQQGGDVVEVKGQAPSLDVYMELTQTNMLGKKIGPYYQITRFCTDIDYYTTAHSAYTQGAAGMSLFNFVYYRPSMPWTSSHKAMVEANGGPLPEMEPPFEIIKNLRSPDWLAQQPQNYFLGNLWNVPYVPETHKLLQKWLANGQTINLEMKLMPPTDGWHNDGKIRIQTTDPCNEMKFRLSFNGRELAQTGDISESYAYPYPKFFGLGDSTNAQAWIVPSKILKKGINAIDITMIKGGTNMLTYIDLAIK